MPAPFDVIENDTYDVVERLETTLERAKRGKIASVAMVTLDVSGTFSTSFGITKDKLAWPGPLGT